MHHVENPKDDTLDKYQNRSASALFCQNSRAQSKYSVVNLIHSLCKQSFCLLFCDKKDILVQKSLKDNQQNKITCVENESTLHSENQPYMMLMLASALREAYVWGAVVQK